MSDDDAARMIRAALAPDVSWVTVSRLVADPPPGVAAAIEARWEVEPARRRDLAWLLGLVPGDDTAAVLLRLLRGRAGEEAAALLRAATRRRLRVPDEELVRLLRDAATAGAAVDAAGVSGSDALVGELTARLDDGTLRRQAAIALGRLGARSSTGELTARLRGLDARDHAGFMVGLELLGDPAAVPALLAWLRHVPDDRAWDVAHALGRLTGRDPLVPLHAKPREQAGALRRAWAGINLAAPVPPPVVGAVAVEDRARGRLTVDGGLGRIRVDYDSPPPGATWPRWDRSLHVAGTPVYRVGSTCGTCETTLGLVGWPPERAAELSGRLREALRDVPGLDPGLIETAGPLLGALPSGHYRAFLVDLDLRRADDPAASWFTRRLADRPGRDPDDAGTDDDADAYWPGTAHHQLAERIPGPVPTYGVVLPTEDLGILSEGTVTEHGAAIGAGARPAAVLFGWVEDRYVEATDQERFLVGMVLDGHHKLEAYARLQVPARALLLCRLEDCWGPPDDRARYLDEVTAPLLIR